ncbi:MAG: DUF3300 domain-containing protein [Alphaproteobacteria bacterium]
MNAFKQAFSALIAAVASVMLTFGAMAQTTQQTPLNDQQLEQLLAPIALYPDALLAQVLTASTYPLEVVQANRWVKANPAAKGKVLEDAMQLQPWDPSVKALTSVPQVLAMMDQKLDWTQQLGDAFLAQQEDVMRAVQVLRERARAAGRLQTTPQQVVTTRIIEQQTIVYIEPANPEIIYVPVYDPYVIYGPWPYPAYPPYYWYPPGYVARNVISFGLGLFVGSIIWGEFDWRDRRVIINVDRYNRYNRTRIDSPIWRHDPVHRRAVPYRDPVVRQRFDRTALPNVDQRRDFRGRVEPPTTRLPTQPTQPGVRPPTQQQPPTTRLPTQPTQPGVRPPTQQQPPTTRLPTQPTQPGVRPPTQQQPPTTRLPTQPTQPTVRPPTQQQPPTTRLPTQPTQPTVRPPTQQQPPVTRLPTQPTQPTVRPPTQPRQPTVQRQTVPAPRAYDGIGRGQDVRRESVRGTESLRSARQPAQTTKPAQPAKPTPPARPTTPAKPAQPAPRQR